MKICPNYFCPWDFYQSDLYPQQCQPPKLYPFKLCPLKILHDGISSKDVSKHKATWHFLPKIIKLHGEGVCPHKELCADFYSSSLDVLWSVSCWTQVFRTSWSRVASWSFSTPRVQIFWWDSLDLSGFRAKRQKQIFWWYRILLLCSPRGPSWIMESLGPVLSFKITFVWSKALEVHALAHLIFATQVNYQNLIHFSFPLL